MGLEMSSWVWGEISCWLCGATSTPYQLCAPTSLGISGTYHKTPPTGAGTPQTDQTWVCFAGGTAWSFWQPVLRPFISATVSNCYDGNFFDWKPFCSRFQQPSTSAFGWGVRCNLLHIDWSHNPPECVWGLLGLHIGDIITRDMEEVDLGTSPYHRYKVGWGGEGGHKRT